MSYALFLISLLATVIGVACDCRDKVSGHLRPVGWLALSLAALAFTLSATQEYSNQKEERNRLSLAFKATSNCINQFEQILLVLYAHTDGQLLTMPTLAFSLEELRTPAAAESIAHLRLMPVQQVRVTPAGMVQAATIHEWVSRNTQRAQSCLTETLIANQSILRSADVAVIRSLVDSPVVKQLANCDEHVNRLLSFFGNSSVQGMNPLEHVNLRLMDENNSNAGEQIVSHIDQVRQLKEFAKSRATDG